MTEMAAGTMATETAHAPASAAVQAHYRGATENFSRHNRDVNWREFESVAYWEHNYRFLRSDDQSIIQTVAAFFTDHFTRLPVEPGSLRAVDVGSGANLYPALATLPWSKQITLTDVSPTNCAWLAKAAGVGMDDKLGNWVWEPFWAEFASEPGYKMITAPEARKLLAERHAVVQCSVMELDRHKWDLGTMFFVAESMTSYENEFEHATKRFLRSLVPGAPFAAAFMDSSVGYVVADHSFPAVEAVNASVVTEVLERYSEDVIVRKVDVPALDPLRDGYEGMIIAVGTTRPS